MLSQIVFVYRDEFVTKLAEKLLREISVNCYGISKVEENFAYIINDLAPQLVMVDEQVYSQSSELINESLSQAEGDFKAVFLSESGEGLESFDLVMKLPIDINTFADQVSSLVEKKS